LDKVFATQTTASADLLSRCLLGCPSGILPYMSGFRSKESLELVITDYYDQLYEKHQRSDSNGKSDEPNDNQLSASQSDFEVALPIRDIRSCRLFDTRLYLQYQRERRTAFAGFHDS
jgi:hypothetical protein